MLCQHEDLAPDLPQKKKKALVKKSGLKIAPLVCYKITTAQDFEVLERWCLCGLDVSWSEGILLLRFQPPQTQQLVFL
jgi:hypothetical protein